MLAAAEAALNIARIDTFEEKRPFRCSLADTAKRNLECVHCYEKGRRNIKRPELGCEELQALSGRLFRDGMRHRSTTDGEPFLDRASKEKCGAMVDAF